MRTLEEWERIALSVRQIMLDGGCDEDEVILVHIKMTEAINSALGKFKHVEGPLRSTDLSFDMREGEFRIDGHKVGIEDHLFIDKGGAERWMQDADKTNKTA